MAYFEYKLHLWQKYKNKLRIYNKNDQICRPFFERRLSLLLFRD
ncbi:hypothetical protein J537_1350 [Acinetobacter baumannii 1437282]|nr:hypothetical protein J537_1350 [Acinetobacter baumannii 1437282]